MFENTLKLTRFALKRERITFPIWILATTIFNALIVLLFIFVMMPDTHSRLELIAMFENPALLAMVGPLHPELGTHSSSLGYIYVLFMMLMCAIAVAIMNIFLVVRHTRTDEELGRYEVLRSLPSGRLANLNAAMVSAIVINAIFAAAFALTMWLSMGAGNDGLYGFGSALLFGVNMGVIGLVFAAIAALFSQLSSTARGALSYSFFSLGFFYFVRAIPDMDTVTPGVGNSEFLAYLSPLGLISRTWVYVDDIWWPVFVVLAKAVVIAAVAYWLCSKRDIQQGLIPARPGKAKGGFLLKTTAGLNTRLLRSSIIAWVLILLLTAASYGTVLDNIEGFVAGSEMYRDLMLAPVPGLLDALKDAPEEQVVDIMNQMLETQGFNIIQMFANMIGFVMAMMAAIPMLMFVLKAKNEENAMRAELLIATPTSRTKYLAGFVVISFITAIFLQFAQALGMYSLAVSMGFDDKLPLGYTVRSTMVYVPALWVMSGLTALFVGLIPKRANWVWAFYGFTFFAMMYGRMLPDIAFLADLTPMGWVPQLPVDEINPATLIILSSIGIALAAVGIMFYNKRDINAETG